MNKKTIALNEITDQELEKYADSIVHGDFFIKFIRCFPPETSSSKLREKLKSGGVLNQDYQPIGEITADRIASALNKPENTLSLLILEDIVFYLTLYKTSITEDRIIQIKQRISSDVDIQRRYNEILKRMQVIDDISREENSRFF